MGTNTPGESEFETDQTTSGSTFFSTWGWALFGMVAFLIFELTASLVWSSLFFSLRFGWKDARTGWFLWRRDPLVPRGRALALLHLAAGLCQVFWVSLLLSILFAVIAVEQQWNQAVRDRFLISSSVLLMTVGAGIIGCGILTLMGTWIAGRNRVKLWVGSETYWSARASIWPPETLGDNRISRVCLLAMVPITCAGMLLFTGVLIGMGKLLIPAGVDKDLLIGIGFGAGCPILGGILYLVGIEKIGRLIGAEWPWECWPELHRSNRAAEADNDHSPQIDHLDSANQDHKN